MKILVIDNYDSFTFNLVHYLEGLGCDVCVWRNDEIDFSAIATFDKIVLSPGPGLPIDAGDMNKLIKTHIESIPILGVCLGFQALVEHFGGEIDNGFLAYYPTHLWSPISSRINFNGKRKSNCSKLHWQFQLNSFIFNVQIQPSLWPCDFIPTCREPVQYILVLSTILFRVILVAR